MLLSWIYGKLNEEQKENFVWGLVGGLVWGLVGGLVGGLVCGLITGHIELLPFLVIVLILSELLFWFDKRKPEKGTSKMWFTVRMKLENITELSLIVGNLMNVFTLRKEIAGFFTQSQPMIMEGLRWVGIVIVVVIICHGFVWVNSLKYRNVKYEEPPKRKGKNKRIWYEKWCPGGIKSRFDPRFPRTAICCSCGKTWSQAVKPGGLETKSVHCPACRSRKWEWYEIWDD